MPIVHEGLFVRVYAVVAVVQYLVWAAVVILAFCRELNIHAFRIRPAPKTA